MRTASLWPSLLLIGIVFAPTTISAEDPKEKVFVRRFVIDETFPWIKVGEIIYFRLEGALAPHGSVTYYRSREAQETILLSGSLAAVSEVFVREKVAITEEFLRSQVPRFLVFLTAQPHSRLLNREYQEEIQQSRSLNDEMKKTISQICREPDLVVKDGEWELRFPVVHGDGSASNWRATGRFDPFSIEKLALESMKNRGALRFSADRP